MARPREPATRSSPRPRTWPRHTRSGAGPATPHHPGRWGHDLRLEIRFADGRSADNNPGRWPRPAGDRLPDPPLLYQSVSGPDGGHVWLWGLPPPGPFTFACTWPTEQIPPSQAELDAGLVLAAAQRVQSLWPDQRAP